LVEKSRKSADVLNQNGLKTWSI